VVEGTPDALSAAKQITKGVEPDNLSRSAEREGRKE